MRSEVIRDLPVDLPSSRGIGRVSWKRMTRRIGVVGSERLDGLLEFGKLYVPLRTLSPVVHQ